MMRNSFIRFWGWALCLVIPAVLMLSSPVVHAQRIVRLRPDRAAPGMNVTMEVITRISSDALFGLPGITPSDTKVFPQNSSDTNRIVIGPVQVSWGSHMMQIPIFIEPNAGTGAIPIVVATNTGSDTVIFTIAKPDHITKNSGIIVLGNGVNGTLSPGNTLLIDSLKATNATITISMQDPDTNAPGNPRLEPVTILSAGPIILDHSTISVDASGKNGGPGGGGGGAGFEGIGGIGFTGGGSCSDTVLLPLNVGSGPEPDSNLIASYGGASITGIHGGGTPPSDQGGGGGTGSPFGINFSAFNASGSKGVGGGGPNKGGYGGGSGGGENTALILEYGGGGGGFGSPGGGGLEQAGPGQNGGNPYGGRFLIPLAGGSGGGAGNTFSNNQHPPAVGGSGGGGGGSIAIMSFDSITLISSALTARGDSGTSGQVNAAGGGGGSGGGIWFAATRGIGGAGNTLFTDGGAGGTGSIGLSGNPDQYAGGAGGSGRIRIDGLIGKSVLAASVDHSSGASVTPITQVLSGDFGRISGLAPDSINTLDTVRIYYRSHHSLWQFLDTLRTKGKWSKWIPLGHDSLLYVMSIVKTNPLPFDQANLEPDWIMSHVGLTIIHHVPSPSIVVVDTSVNFGKVREGKCQTRWIRIYNDGEAPLVIDLPTILGSNNFTVLSGKTTIPGYTTDSIEVQFCPDTLGQKKGTLTLISNDSESSPRSVSLTGTGVHRSDSLRFIPKLLHFGRVKVDSCKTDTVTLTSLGTDTLDLAFQQWNAPPFKAQILGQNSLLAPDSSMLMLVTFCPTDTATARSMVSLDARSDTLQMDGNGKLRRFEVADTLALGTFCFGTPIPFSEAIRSTGNDAVTLESVLSSAANIQTTLTTPFILNLNLDDTVRWTIMSGIPGRHQDMLTYTSLDATLRTIITYRIVRPLIVADSSVVFDFRCVSDVDTVIVVSLHNPTSDTIHISNLGIQPSLSFSFSGKDTVLAPGESSSVAISFHPATPNHLTDILQFTARTLGCDSIYTIPISGTGTIDGLAADSLDFGSVVVGGCREDSLRIQNTCGPTATIDSIHVHDAQFKCTANFPLTIPSKSSVEIHFMYCPTAVGFIAETIQIQPHDTTSFSTILRGIGSSKPARIAYFRITSAPLIQPDSIARTELWLDSASFGGIDSLMAVKISFDPSVVYPVGGTPMTTSLILPDTLAVSPFSLDFSKTPVFVEAIDWRGLIGPRTFTSLGLTIVADTPLDVRVTQGGVTVQDCYGLNGRISVAGPYKLGQVNADLAPGRGEVSVELGNDGFVEASIYDVTGRLSKQVLSGYMKPGTYQLALPFSGIASGRYFLVVSSLGWREVRPFSLDR